MLTQLRIKGLAIIELLDIEFSRGFNVITGETGAGKSILIKALGLLLGSKANSDVVRAGFEQAVVSGAFEVPPNHKSLELLSELGIETHQGHHTCEILVRRNISASGNKSTAWINDVPVTLASLRRFGYVLIDIFGQHENQRLLDPSEHIFYLDKFIPPNHLFTEIEDSHAECMKSFREIQTVIANYKTRYRDKDYLNYRVNELETFGPTTEEYLSLTNLCDMAAKQSSLKEKISLLQNLLDNSSGDGQPLSSVLNKASSILTDLSDFFPSFQGLGDGLTAMISQLDDISYQVEKALNSFSVDDESYESAQNRLADYQNFFRKLTVNGPEELMEEHRRLKQDLDSLESASENVASLLQQLHSLASELQHLCGQLTKERTKAAKVICKRVEQELNELGMKGAKFQVEFQPIAKPVNSIDVADFMGQKNELINDISSILSQVSPLGSEKAQFLLASNIGEPPKHLAKIASGGEVSRVMLAIKRALAAGAETCVLVFDEIDTGISGRIADVVGRKIKELSKNFQVICISHLPQVAVYGDQHFLVEKVQRKNRTESHIIPLSSEKSSREIARLLSGTEITDRSLENAKALVERARLT